MKCELRTVWGYEIYKVHGMPFFKLGQKIFKIQNIK